MLLLAMFVLNIRAMHAISFSGSWTQLMTTQALVSQIKNALNSATSNSASFQLFNNVNAFTFRCVIKVHCESLLKIKPISQNNNTITWSFNTALDVNLFKNAKHGDIIRSNYFTINNCEFYSECTPNGWGQTAGACIWCGLHLIVIVREWE
eukprot:484987_1